MEDFLYVVFTSIIPVLLQKCTPGEKNDEDNDDDRLFENLIDALDEQG